MDKALAIRTVNEITTHVSSKLQGIPGVTNNILASLVYGWLRQEQPEVLKVFTATEILGLIESDGGAGPSPPLVRRSA